jgi:ATP-dependent DNA helicase RecG
VILEEIGKNTYITAQQLSDILGISLRKTKENLSKLKERGIIRRVGPDKGGYWEIIKEK